MHGTLPATLPLLVTGCGPPGLALRCLAPLAAGPLLALAGGVELGRLELPEGLAADAVVAVPITRLPWLPPPYEIRIAAAPEGPDLALPWPLAGPEAALALLGPPRPLVADLRLEHGVLRGTLLEPANGLLAPVLYARVNGSMARAVAVEPAVARAEGGCACRFALPLHAADLGAAGLDIALHLLGQEAPLARYAWAPAGPGAVEAGLARLEAALARQAQDQAAAIATLQAGMAREQALQRERVEAFIEAAATLLLDRLAGPGGAAEERRAALLGLVGTLAPPALVPPPAQRREELGAHAAQFGAGWHAPEDTPHGSFRWMSETGLLVNPWPARPLTAVLLELPHLYRAAAPDLVARFDETPAKVAVMPAGAHGHLLRVTPEAVPLAAATLQLASRTGGSPARDGVSSDARMLSVAVARVVFLYAE